MAEFAGMMSGQGPDRNTCACGHRRRDHRIEGPPGGPLADIRWFECEVCDCDQFDGSGGEA